MQNRITLCLVVTLSAALGLGGCGRQQASPSAGQVDVAAETKKIEANPNLKPADKQAAIDMTKQMAK